MYYLLLLENLPIGGGIYIFDFGEDKEALMHYASTVKFPAKDRVSLFLTPKNRKRFWVDRYREIGYIPWF